MASIAPVVGRDQEIARIFDALRAGVSTLIVGEAGLGKSAVAREIGDRLRRQEDPPLVLLGGRPTGSAVPSLDAVVTGRPAVVVVDDVHLLEPAGADQLSRLITEGRTRLVATARTDGTPLSSIGWLWSAGACERLALAPLAPDSVRLLIERQLGGEVDEAVVHAVRERSRGNPLMLEHLVRAGIKSGALARDRRTWRLAGALPLPAAAADLIRMDLDGLPDSQLETLQTVALAQPLRLSVALRVASERDLEALETRRLILVDAAAVGPTVTCAHPLYSELLRRDLGVLRTRRLRGRLLSAFDAETDGERLLVASWCLDLGQAVDATELLACARIAASDDAGLAESFLHHVLRADSTDDEAADASALLARLLLLQDRVAEADHTLHDARKRLTIETDVAAEHRAALAAVRVMVRTRLGEIGDALGLLGTAPMPAPSPSSTGGQATSFGAPDTGLLTQALHAQLMLLDGHLDVALRIAEPMLRDSVVATAAPDGPIARATAAYVVVAALSFTGRIHDTDTALERARPALAAARYQLPFGLAVGQVSAAIGHVFAGHLATAARRARSMRETADHEGDPWQRPRSSTVLGLLALHRGDVATAVEHLRAAIATLTALDAMFVRYNLAFLARAAALAGHLHEAQQALEGRVDAPEFPLYQADWQIAEAAVLAASSRPDAAAEYAMIAAGTARSHGQWGIAAMAAHDAARYAGREDAAVFLTAAADLLDGPLPPLMRDHALARSTSDVDLLRRVSVEFERLGYTLFAAEAAYTATAHLLRVGDRTTADIQACRAAELHGRCRHAYLPWAFGSAIAALTARERDVAVLAAGGHTDRQIADHLQISVRTVQTHLTHVYGKLQISRRSHLACALSTDRRRR